METGDSDVLCVQVSLSQEELTNSCWVEMDADGDGSITSQEQTFNQCSAMGSAF